MTRTPNFWTLGFWALGLISFTCLFNQAASAHGTERGLVMLLPTGYYRLGGGLAVAASFLLLAVFPSNWIVRKDISSILILSFKRLPRHWISALSFVFLILLCVAGITGETDTYANPMPLFIWTIWWVGFTILQFVTGNLWPYLNPWTGPVYFVRHIWRPAQVPLTFPKWVKYWPALLLFMAFSWLELISIAPDDPQRLTHMVIIYWVIGFIGMLVFGEKQWFGQADPFAILFRLIGGFSPFQTRRLAKQINLSFGWPGRGLINLPSLPLSGILFILLTLSSVSFDGFSKTFTWASWIGINPLEFPGRGAVFEINSFGFLAVFMALSFAFLISVYLGCLFAKQTELFFLASGRLIYAIIPISLAFHLAHYLTVLLVNMQYALLAFNDPFALGWDLLGVEGYMVTTSFLTTLDLVEILWQMQTAVIVLGHIISIYLAHNIASNIFGIKNATRSQAGLALLMVFYTLFGLWLLSTPTMG